MDEKGVVELLDSLAVLRGGEAALRDEYTSARNAAVPPEVTAELERVDREFKERIARAARQTFEVEAQVLAATLVLGHTVKGTVFQAVWSKGRVTWDVKALDGYATAHPELWHFRSEKEPTVGIRQVGKGA